MLQLACQTDTQIQIEDNNRKVHYHLTLTLHTQYIVCTL